MKAPVVTGLAAMVLAMLFFSTFAAGAGAIMVSVGLAGSAVGFAFVQSPLANAAAGSLRKEEVGGGMGIFQGLAFLGGGAGAALLGAFLAAREGADTGAINPLYGLSAAPFSDAYLVAGLALVVALVAALGLRGGTGKVGGRAGKEKEEGR